VATSFRRQIYTVLIDPRLRLNSLVIVLAGGGGGGGIGYAVTHSLAAAAAVVAVPALYLVVSMHSLWFLVEHRGWTPPAHRERRK
jgi:hypothetical protein